MTFPSPSLKPGCFLGIACSCGDEFSCYVLDESQKRCMDADSVFKQSVIHPWNGATDLAPQAVCTEVPNDNAIFPVVVSQEFDATKLFQDVDREEDKAMQQIVDDNQEEVPVAARTRLATQEEPTTFACSNDDITTLIALLHERPSHARMD